MSPSITCRFCTGCSPEAVLLQPCCCVLCDQCGEKSRSICCRCYTKVQIHTRIRAIEQVCFHPSRVVDNHTSRSGLASPMQTKFRKRNHLPMVFPTAHDTLSDESSTTTVQNKKQRSHPDDTRTEESSQSGLFPSGHDSDASSMISEMRLPRKHEELAEIEEPPRLNRSVFDHHLDQLRDYIEKVGHCRFFTSDYKHLLPWLSSIDKSNLTEDQIRALDQLPWRDALAVTKPSRKQKRFDERLDELKAYKEKHGHCKVPYIKGRTDNNVELKSLSEWVAHVRRGVPKLTEEQKAELDEVGFHWEKLGAKHEREWQERYHRLLDYKSVFGHVNVPWGWKEDPQLSEWCNTQRKFLKSGRIKPEREKLLRELGFDFRETSKRPPRKGDVPKLATTIKHL